MKKYILILIVSFLSINVANAVGVCYQSQGDNGGIDCFNSNGSCEDTFPDCGTNGEWDNGCTCYAIAPPCSSCEVDYLLSFVDDSWTITRTDNGVVILTISSTITDIEDFETVFQVRVIEELMLVEFNIYDGEDLADGYENKSEALLKTTKVAFN